MVRLCHSSVASNASISKSIRLVSRYLPSTTQPYDCQALVGAKVLRSELRISESLKHFSSAFFEIRAHVSCLIAHPPILGTNVVRGHARSHILIHASLPHSRRRLNQLNVASAAEACPSKAVFEWRYCSVEVTTSAGKHNMASSSYPTQNGGHDHIIRPRPVKPGNPMVLRAQSEEGSLKHNGHIDTMMSGTSRYAIHQILIPRILLNS